MHLSLGFCTTVLATPSLGPWLRITLLCHTGLEPLPVEAERFDAVSVKFLLYIMKVWEHGRKPTREGCCQILLFHLSWSIRAAMTDYRR